MEILAFPSTEKGEVTKVCSLSCMVPVKMLRVTSSYFICMDAKYSKGHQCGDVNLGRLQYINLSNQSSHAKVLSLSGPQAALYKFSTNNFLV